MSQGHNPYQAPKTVDPIYVAQSVQSEGVWRDGRLLVMSKQATLPNICVKSNTPAVTMLKRKLYWHHPAVYLAILFNLIVYAILAIALRKQATIYVGLSEGYVKRRRMWMVVAWLTCLAAVGLFVAGFIASVANDGNTPLVFLMLGGVVLFFAALIAAIIATRVVTAKKIDDHYVWLKGAHPEFLARFPELASVQGK